MSFNNELRFPKPVKKKKSNYKNKKTTKSIIQFEKECYIEQFTDTVCEGELVEHHIFEGNGRREYSEADGLKVWTCSLEHHTGDSGAHQNRELDITLKKIAQMYYEAELGTREEFRRRYGKSYL